MGMPENNFLVVFIDHFLYFVSPDTDYWWAWLQQMHLVHIHFI